MAVYAYMRYSTGKQEEAEQAHIIKKYCERKGITVTDKVIDRATSGAVSWEDRNLANLVGKLKPGDTIICSEASRISRSMADFSTFVNSAMQKLQTRLIICNMDLDIDCSCISAMTQMQLQMLLFAAQLERELIKSRVKAAMDDRKERVKRDGGWISKNGNWCTGFGLSGQKASDAARLSADRKKAKTLDFPHRDAVIEKIRTMRAVQMSYEQCAMVLNNEGFRTARGNQWHAPQIQRLLKYIGEDE
jgi:DNA invertase Pin-like site-specific DNA recombinase